LKVDCHSARNRARRVFNTKCRKPRDVERHGIHSTANAKGDFVTTTLWEGDCVRHSGGFVGVHVGFTRLAGLMERTGDLRGVRVQLPDGTIRIASEYSLEKVQIEEYQRYASTLGIEVKIRKPPSVAKRS
jgi:hypothetical protein